MVLVRPLYRCCVTVAAAAVATRRNASRTVAPRAGIKKRKIENETVSCRVTVRLNANVQTRTRLGEEGEKRRTMVEARDMRGCGFSASLSRKVSSGLRSFFLVFFSCFFSFFFYLFFCASAVSAAENRDIRSIRHGR